MARYTREQIDSVAQIDMLNFLSSEYGYHFYKKEKRFSCIECPNLSIDTNRILWYLQDKKIGGYGIFAWMSKVEEQNFKSVMFRFLGTDFEPAILVEDPAKEYTQEQINSVKQTDMVDFLSSEYGYHFHRKGKGFSCTEHSSLFINPDRLLWYWNSQQVGGKGVIEWLHKVENMSFPNIMSKMLGKTYTSATITEYIKESKTDSNKKKYFDNDKIPLKTNDKFSNLFAYLTKSRCLSSSLISELVKSHRIYQDTRNNVVFVNPNEKGEVGFWCLRGTNTEKKFTRNMPGSNNPYYGFALDAQCECDTLYVFEAPIDLLSHCTIADIKYGTGNWHNQHRIALCGVNDTALRYYLTSHKNITTIKFCLDNDNAGTTAARKLMNKYYELGYTIQLIDYKNSPKKDINEMLCDYVNKNKEKYTGKNSKSEDTQNPEDIITDYMTENDYEIEEKPPIASTGHSKKYSMDYMGRF